MNDPSLDTLQRAIQGEPDAVKTLLRELTPVIQLRVGRALLRRRRPGSARDMRQEVEDMVQEVFLFLFDHDARALRAWDSSRGLSLSNFVGLLAERTAVSILRSGRRSPWTEEPTLDDEIDKSIGLGATSQGQGSLTDARVESREFLERLLDRLREATSPRGYELFHLLFVEDRSVESICQGTGMQPDAVYAWKSRLGKLVRSLAIELAEISVSDSEDQARMQ